jgi:hypothetical protein
MRALLFGSLLLPLLAGCGGGKSKVSGQVRFNGAPLPGGVLTFQPADPKHNSVAVSLDEQGNYQATLPVGEVQAAIDNRALQPRQAGPRGVAANLPAEVRNALSNVKSEAPPPPNKGNSDAAKPRGKYVALPPKYYTIENSGVKFTVEPGPQKHDIELKPEP